MNENKIIIKTIKRIGGILQIYLDDEFIKTERGYTIDPKSLSELITSFKQGRIPELK